MQESSKKQNFIGGLAKEFVSEFSLKKAIPMVVISIGIAFLLRYYFCMADIMAVKEGSAVLHAAIRLVVATPWTYVMALVISVISLLLSGIPKAQAMLFRYRYAITGVIFVVCVWIGLNGSSLGYWCELFGIEDKGLLMGYSRIIRSDEFSVATPSFFAQKRNDFGNAFAYYSDVINGSQADLFMGIRQPIAHILTIFRPFLLGYLFLPANQALAFYWCGKNLALFWASFEFGRLLTKDRKGLSLIYALLMTLSPAMQWWFSGCIMDLMIYAQWSILAFRAFLTNEKLWKRLLLLIAIFFCMGSFVLCLYPSWQVPMVYWMLPVIVWVAWTSRKESKLTKWDYIAIGIGVAGLVGAAFYVYSQSKDTLALITGTVYPGEREETGGGEPHMLFTYGIDSLFTLFNKGFGVNISESATMIDFFPFCIVLPIIALLYGKKKDSLTISLLVVDAILLIWVIIGFPSWLAKVSFLSNSQPARTKVVVGIVNLILLFRGLTLKWDEKGSIGRWLCVICIGGAIAIAFGSTVTDYQEYMSPLVFFGLVLASYLLLAIGVRVMVISNQNKNYIAPAVGVTLMIALLFGGMANPIRIGADSVYQIPWIQGIEAETEADAHQGIWVVESTDAPAVPHSDLPLWAGAKTMNATAIYPNLDLWHKLDEQGIYEDVYNRYAHINVFVKDEGPAEFVLDSEDTFSVYLTLEDLKCLGAKYITGKKTFVSKDEDVLDVIAENDVYYIYRLR